MKTAVITGAASGIGYEFAKLLAKDLYQLVLIDRDEQKLELVKQELAGRYPVQVETFVIDLTLAHSAKALFHAMKDKDIDVLINNAGFGVKGAFAETNWEQEQHMIQLHVLTLTHVTKLFLGQMLAARRGKILNVASMAAFQPGPYMAVYYATKSYILSFSRAIAHELKHTGVTITVLCPGPTRTGFQKGLKSEHSLLSRQNWLMAPAQVALYGYKALMKGKVVAVPGLIYRFVVWLERFLPANTLTAIMSALQKKNAPVRTDGGPKPE